MIIINYCSPIHMSVLNVFKRRDFDINLSSELTLLVTTELQTVFLTNKVGKNLHVQHTGLTQSAVLRVSFFAKQV